MQNINSIAELKNAIQFLEVKRAAEGQLLKEQFYITFESLKPVSILKNALNDIASSPYLIDNILGAVMGLFSGYMTKKIVVGTSGNLLRKLIGSVLQFGVTNLVSNHSDAIKSFGQYIVKHILRKKEMNSK